MAVLKHTSPTAWPLAPKPKPRNTVPSASARTAVGLGSAQAPSRSAGSGCLSCIEDIDCDMSLEPGFDRASISVIAEGIAVLREEINSALKTAMKARDERRVSTLRLINAAINNAEIEAEMRGRAPLKEDEVVVLLQKMIKQRRESVEI